MVQWMVYTPKMDLLLENRGGHLRCDKDSACNEALLDASLKFHACQIPNCKSYLIDRAKLQEAAKMYLGGMEYRAKKQLMKTYAKHGSVVCTVNYWTCSVSSVIVASRLLRVQPSAAPTIHSQVSCLKAKGTESECEEHASKPWDMKAMGCRNPLVTMRGKACNAFAEYGLERRL